MLPRFDLRCYCTLQFSKCVVDADDGCGAGAREQNMHNNDKTIPIY